MKRAGRGFLVLQGIGLIVIALALLGDAGPRNVSGAFDNAALAPGALWGAGIGIGAGFALAIWSIARPASSATVVAWSAAFFALPAFVMPFVWRVPAPTSGSLDAMQMVQGIEAVRVASIGTLTLAFGAMALGFAALAAARRARREAPPELGWRAIVIGLACTFAFAAVTTWVRTGPTEHATFLLVVPGALSILALTAAATARANADTKDVWHAILLSFGAMVLAWSSAWLGDVGQIDLSGMSFRSDIDVEITKDALRSARRALPVFGPWLVAVVLAMPSSRNVWVLARQAGPIAVGFLVAGACVTVMRTALARAQHVGDQWEWPELTDNVVDDEDCGSVPPHSIVWAGNGSVRLPSGDVYKSPFDFDGIAANVDAMDSSADIWLAVDPTTGKWGDIGGVIDAVGRRRGPRGVGISSDEPMEGCAVRLVGQWKGKVACSGAIGIGVDGCTAGSSDERHWRVSVQGSDVDIRMEEGKVLIAQKRRSRDELASAAFKEWSENGWHRDPSDQRFDHMTLELPSQMPMREALKIVGAVRETKRTLNQMGRQEKRPAFVVSLALSSQ